MVRSVLLLRFVHALFSSFPGSLARNPIEVRALSAARGAQLSDASANKVPLTPKFQRRRPR